MENPILEVKNLCIRYNGAPTDAVRDVSFTLGRERLGIVGESGSGKSTVGRALLRLLPSAQVTAEKLRFEDIDLLSLSEAQMLKVRGRRMSMILQDPKFSLNRSLNLSRNQIFSPNLNLNCSPICLPSRSHFLSQIFRPSNAI